MTDPAFFGYGSLVNLATHGYADPRPATLPGWRRVWRTTSARDLAFLSVERADSAIDGILARVPGADWAALDAREAAYTRVDITATLQTPHPTAIYQVQGPDHPAAPILLSYLDVVVQGFLRVYGAEGVARFFATTTGWQGGIHDDRAAPLYPRAQTLTPAETALVDRHLMAVLEQAE